MSRHLLLVAGSGRSGSSVFVGIVGNLGFLAPKPWVPADASNPRGFGESQWVVNTHTALLRQANVQVTDARPTAWADTARVGFGEQFNAQVRGWLQDKFSRHDQVVIKDPRLLWFLPLWHRVGSELGAAVDVVTMLRHPAEVVSSKLHWYPNMPLVDANRVAGWINTMLFTERATRDYRRTFIRFEDLLEDWTQPIARISKQFDIPTLVDAPARDQSSAASLIDPTLHRSKATWKDLDVPDGLIHLAEQVWEALLPLADIGASDGGSTLTRLDKHREEYASFYRFAEHVAQSTTLAATRELLEKKSPIPKAQPEPSASSQLRQATGADSELSDEYRRMLRRIRELVRASVPHEATVAVITRGDDRLIDLYGRRALHFPQDETGRYAGYYPATSVGAIAQLEVLRASGADFLLVPETAMWWLDYYGDFERHLRHRYRTVSEQDGLGALFALSQTSGSEWDELTRVIAECERVLDGGPVILDWDTGLDLADRLRECVVFSPPDDSDALPYLDATVDLVAIAASASAERRAEADRVARLAVLVRSSSEHRFDVVWKTERRPSRPAVSLVVDATRGGLSRASLFSLRETLANRLVTEVVLLADARKRGEDLDEGDCVRTIEVAPHQRLGEAYHKAVRATTGDVLAFVDARAVLLPDSLATLVSTLLDRDDAGAVGATLVGPLGTLCHAGGSVRSAGHALEVVVTRGGEAKLEHAVVRPVDFCSLALLATPRDAYEAVGGFERAYRQARYLAADYCLTLRGRGLRTYYQPDSVAVILATDGDDAEASTPPPRFVERWRNVVPPFSGANVSSTGRVAGAPDAEKGST